MMMGEVRGKSQKKRLLGEDEAFSDAAMSVVGYAGDLLDLSVGTFVVGTST